MSVVKWKLFFVWSFDKEEQWLNDMANNGYLMTKALLGRYTFERGEPGAYTYRLELLDNPPYARDSAAYLNFLEDTGVEYITSWARWVYLRRRKDSGEFDLFSNLDSQINHLKKVRLLNFAAVLCMLPSAVNSWNWALAGGDAFNWILAVVCTTLGTACLYGLIRIISKIRQLERERLTRE